MIVLLIQPGEEPALSEIDGTLVSMQKVVGGPIELIYPFDDPVVLVCHEEGKLLGLPLNRSLRDQTGKIYDAIAGTFFLPEELVGKYQERFIAPEIFVQLNGSVVCIPVR